MLNYSDIKSIVEKKQGEGETSLTITVNDWGGSYSLVSVIGGKYYIDREKARFDSSDLKDLMQVLEVRGYKTSLNGRGSFGILHVDF